jgi:hypothetical protein
MKRDLNGASSDLSAVSVVTLPDPVSESEEEVDAVIGVWHVGEYAIHTSEGFIILAPPKLGIALLLLTVIRSHDPSVDILPRSSAREYYP